jgi:hypothetical protein
VRRNNYLYFHIGRISTAKGPEAGKVTFKSNGNEALCDESLLKNSGYETFYHDSLYKSNTDEVLNKE